MDEGGEEEEEVDKEYENDKDIVQDIALTFYICTDDSLPNTLSLP